MLIECERMHIDTADNVTMANKATFAACPISALGLVFMLAYRTLATCASFRASKALDASLCGFMGEVVDVLAILPQGHPSGCGDAPGIAIADTVGIAHEEGANLCSWQKSMTLRAALWRRSRTLRSALRHCLFLAHCSRRHLRERFLQRDRRFPIYPASWFAVV